MPQVMKSEVVDLGLLGGIAELTPEVSPGVAGYRRRENQALFEPGRQPAQGAVQGFIERGWYAASRSLTHTPVKPGS